MKQDFQFRIRFPLKYCSISLTSKSTRLLILQGWGGGGPHCNSCSFEKGAWTLTLKGWPTDFPLGSERRSPLKYFHSEGWSGRQRKRERAEGRVEESLIRIQLASLSSVFNRASLSALSFHRSCSLPSSRSHTQVWNPRNLLTASRLLCLLRTNHIK